MCILPKSVTQFSPHFLLMNRSLYTDFHFNSSRIVYWSYGQEEKNTWFRLGMAKKKFGEETARGSEPDVIIKNDKALFFIEAKLSSGNKTVPSD